MLTISNAPRAGATRRATQLATTLAGLVLTYAGTSLASPPGLPTVALTIQGHTVHAELAATPETLRRGLMQRHELSDNTGMLFVLGAPDRYCFWMKDTLIPLSIAFVDAQGMIVDIQDMQALDLSTHCSPAPVTMALEVPQGWFSQHDIRPNAYVTGLPADRPLPTGD